MYFLRFFCAYLYIYIYVYFHLYVSMIHILYVLIKHESYTHIAIIEVVKFSLYFEFMLIVIFSKTLIRKLESILIKLYRQNVSLLFNQTCLNERLLPNYTYIHIYICVSCIDSADFEVF